MADVETLLTATPALRLNVADRLTKFVAAMADSIAVACPRRRSLRRAKSQRGGLAADYATITFAELDADASRIARGFAAWGVPPGTRLALLVRPGIEFVTLVFALLRAGVVIVLVDPGLGRRNLIRCLAEAQPEGFVAIGVAQAARLFLRQRFPRARWNVTVGPRWFWNGKTLCDARALGVQHPDQSLPVTRPDDPAAIIFTSGSTGPPKGVLYTQRMFDTQVAEIQSAYGIEPGRIDLACFPLFALFNAAMGVTTVMPEMDFSRPAAAKPARLLAAANDWKVTQAFASPAVWRVLSDHCSRTGQRIQSLRQVFSCGAPVPADVLRATLACVGADATMHTPYGATECLPVSTIEAAEVLGETAERTDHGAGICVGRKFGSVQWRVIPIHDESIATIDDDKELRAGEIGELIVRGPQVSPVYVTCAGANLSSKIGFSSTEYSVLSTQKCGLDPEFDVTTVGQWHRTGDVGYFDEKGRFWYCGRKSQRVETRDGTIFTECVEAIFNTHPAVRRCALVGVGPLGAQTPVVIVEREVWWNNSDKKQLHRLAQAHSKTAAIEHFLVVKWRLPVDVRHNAKINREQLASWASTQSSTRVQSAN